MVSPIDILDTANIDKLIERLQQKGKSIKSFIMYRDPELRLTLWYSLGFLAKKYLTMSEKLLKKDEEYQSTHFAKKANTTRRVCKAVFKTVPDEDYYTGMFKECPKVATKVPQEQLQQMAAFCAENVQFPEDMPTDAKNLIKVLKEGVRRRHELSFMRKYARIINGLIEEYKENPDKLTTLYELLILLDMVREVSKMLKEKGKEEKDPMAGFNVEEEDDESSPQD